MSYPLAVRVDDGLLAVDVGLNHQASGTPGAPDVIAVVVRTRIGNGTERLAYNRSNHASSQRNNQDLVAGQLTVYTALRADQSNNQRALYDVNQFTDTLTFLLHLYKVI